MYIIVIDFCFLVVFHMPEEITEDMLKDLAMMHAWCALHLKDFTAYQAWLYYTSLQFGIDMLQQNKK